MVLTEKKNAWNVSGTDSKRQSWVCFNLLMSEKLSLCLCWGGRNKRLQWEGVHMSLFNGRHNKLLKCYITPKVEGSSLDKIFWIKRQKEQILC